MKNRVNKADIYNQYAIEFKAGKISAPMFGYINPLLVDGNEKIGKGVWHFSTLPGTSVFHIQLDSINSFNVAGTCVCDCPGCYAKSGNYNYSSVIKALGIRTLLAREYMTFTEKAINAQIQAENIKFIRIHASGDFFNMEYVEMWKRIAAANPNVTMWTYTKNAKAENAFDDVPNVNIVKSVIPGKGFNFGHCDYILSCYEFLKNAGKTVYICRCGIDKNQHCTNCKGCSKNEFVLFIEHSTAYKAEKDPLFPVIKALIESQAAQ